jgi:hypothetical protein
MPFTMRRAGPLCLLVVTSTAVALSACGGDGGDSTAGTSSSSGDDREAVTAVVNDYTNAFADGDFDKACDLLSDDSRDQIEQAAKEELDVEGCSDALEKVTGALDDKTREALRGLSVTSVQIDGDRAVVKTKLAESGEETDPAVVVKEDGEWRLAPAEDEPPSAATVTTP